MQLHELRVIESNGIIASNLLTASDRDSWTMGRLLRVHMVIGLRCTLRAILSTYTPQHEERAAFEQTLRKLNGRLDRQPSEEYDSSLSKYSLSQIVLETLVSSSELRIGRQRGDLQQFANFACTVVPSSQFLKFTIAGRCWIMSLVSVLQSRELRSKRYPSRRNKSR